MNVCKCSVVCIVDFKLVFFYSSSKVRYMFLSANFVISIETGGFFDILKRYHNRIFSKICILCFTYKILLCIFHKVSSIVFAENDLECSLLCFSIFLDKLHVVKLFYQVTDEIGLSQMFCRILWSAISDRISRVLSYLAYCTAF